MSKCNNKACVFNSCDGVYCGIEEMIKSTPHIVKEYGQKSNCKKAQMLAEKLNKEKGE